jgi:hypothetical protein
LGLVDFFTNLLFELFNADMHLKNRGLLYRDRRHAERAPILSCARRLVRLRARFSVASGPKLRLLAGSKFGVYVK